MGKIRKCFRSVTQFLNHDIWNIRLNELSGMRRFWTRQLRIYLLVGKGFNEDKCQLRAASLTFYSALSVVPVLAMIFGIAKGFDLERKLEEELKNNFAGQQEVLTWLIDFANKMLENTQGSLIAGLGFVILFWSVVKVLSNIEASFNNVWQIKKQRNWGRKFSDYAALMIFAPVLLVASSGVTVVLKTMLTQFTQGIGLTETVGPLLSFLINLTPFFLVWVLFTLLYTFIPNTHVKLKSGLIAGILAGSLYQVFQLLYIEFQGMLTSYNAVYGSFAALPFFLIWMQLSWLVVLLGAEISFADQNVENYEYKANNISYNNKRLLSLYVLNLIIHHFKEEKQSLHSQEISHQLGIPISLVHAIVFKLNQVGLISELMGEKNKQSTYQPSFDINKMTVSNVIDKLEKWEQGNLPIPETKNYTRLKSILEDYRTSFKATPKDILLKDLQS